MNNLKNLDYEYAYRYCKEIAIRHYENFPVGSLLIPKSKRKFIYSIYAFARTADDIADSSKSDEKTKLKKLYEFENELNKSLNSEFDKLIPETENIFIALYDTVNTLNIPADELRNLLIAFRQDAVKQRYNNFSELAEYSEYSANPVGHLVLLIFNYNKSTDSEAFRYSDKVCTALQLTNFWQDVSEDLKLNRIYIPEDIMKEYNYSYDLLFRKEENDDFLKMMKALIDRTRILFAEGRKILDHVKGRLRLELKATISGGEEILNKIESMNYRVLSRRVKISNYDKLRIISSVLIK
ncbi:MAG: squalene synthase HpnC [Ignavibacteria bacterium]|nr:squalene synthase HpnC [Ignavibacteria bacterium]